MTVTVKPALTNQYAAVGPAMDAPAMRTLPLDMLAGDESVEWWMGTKEYALDELIVLRVDVEQRRE